MTLPSSSAIKPATGCAVAPSLEVDESFGQQAILSTALVSIFRGNFCDFILPNRKTTSFKKHSVIYEVGDPERTLYFLRDGFVKVGTVTADGREIIYDVRKKGDVIGELCASAPVRSDRAWHWRIPMRSVCHLQKSWRLCRINQDWPSSWSTCFATP
jgi:hypothetical protein